MFTMRLVSTLCLITAFTSSALAQGASGSWPAGTSLGGIGLTAPNGAECIVLPTGSTSLAASSAHTYINLPSVYGDGGLTYIPPNFLSGAPAITYVGAADLVFDTATTGQVHFDYYYTSASILAPKPPAPPVRFTGYRAAVSGSPPTLHVTVASRIGGCEASLRAIYHRP